ncbi:hypothetical protein HZS_5000 [Henneguya salminicola]|nr:hypothetical protein HZS_5000 [Henneguya salminicola]
MFKFIIFNLDLRHCSFQMIRIYVRKKWIESKFNKNKNKIFTNIIFPLEYKKYFRNCRFLNICCKKKKLLRIYKIDIIGLDNRILFLETVNHVNLYF